MFWNRKTFSHASTQLSHAEQVNEMAAAVLASTTVELAKAPKDEKTFVSVFLFGMISAHGMLNKLPQEQTIALARGAFQSVFKLKLVEANKAVQDGVKATKPGPHQKMTPILHGGIDGHAQYTSGNHAAFTANLRERIAALREARA